MAFDSLELMPPWSLAAIAFLLAAGGSFIVGERALSDSRDLLALYWLSAGTVTLRAAFLLSRKRPS
jgi:hypothetical protein